MRKGLIPVDNGDNELLTKITAEEKRHVLSSDMTEHSSHPRKRTANPWEGPGHPDEHFHYQPEKGLRRPAYQILV